MSKQKSHTRRPAAARLSRAAALIFSAVTLTLCAHGAAAQTQLKEEAAKQLRVQAEEL